jgi:hypothetical protein
MSSACGFARLAADRQRGGYGGLGSASLPGFPVAVAAVVEEVALATVSKPPRDPRENCSKKFSEPLWIRAFRGSDCRWSMLQ